MAEGVGTWEVGGFLGMACGVLTWRIFTAVRGTGGVDNEVNLADANGPPHRGWGQPLSTCHSVPQPETQRWLQGGPGPLQVLSVPLMVAFHLTGSPLIVQSRSHDFSTFGSYC